MSSKNERPRYICNNCNNCDEDYPCYAEELRVDDAGERWCKYCWSQSVKGTGLGEWCELAPFVPLQTRRIEELEAENARLWEYSAEWTEDGYIEIEWSNSPQDVFSFAINESGDVSFSGILDGFSVYGSGNAVQPVEGE